MIVTDFDNESIEAFSYDENGIPQKFQLKKLPIDLSVKDQLVGTWKLQSFQQIDNPDSFESWSSNFSSAPRQLQWKDLQEQALTLSFSQDSSFEFELDKQKILFGNWEIDRTGQFIKLISYFGPTDDRISRQKNLVVLSLNEGMLSLHSNIAREIGKQQFESLEIIHKYQKVIEPE